MRRSRDPSCGDTRVYREFEVRRELRRREQEMQAGAQVNLPEIKPA